MEGVRHVPYSTSLVVDVLPMSRHCRSRSMERVLLHTACLTCGRVFG